MRRTAAITGLIGLMAGAALDYVHRVQRHTRAISADTLIVQDQLNYLYQINAQGIGQTCRFLNKVIDCGKASWTKLMNLIASIYITFRRPQELTDRACIGSCLAKSPEENLIVVFTGQTLVPPEDLARFSDIQAKAKAKRCDLRKNELFTLWQWKAVP